MIKINRFHATDPFLYLLKTEKQKNVFYAFKGYKKRLITWNW